MSKSGKKNRKKSKKTSYSWAQILRRWVWRLGLVFVAILLLPYFLIILYRADFINPVSTLMVYEIFTGRTYQREWVELEDISSVLVQSVMMSEDGQFCAHKGVDWDAINLVIESALDGEGARGASTITMQTSKNLFLWNSRSYIRKGLEMPLALFSDYVWGKQRTLEIYLNIAEWGHGIYGIESASQIYFGRQAKDLTRKQAALLAVALPNPLLRNPAKPSSGLQRLASRIETRARQSGAYIKCIYP